MLRWADRLRTGYLFIPMACAVLAIGGAIVLVVVDRSLGDRGVRWTFAGGPQNASDTLTTVASSMITFTGLVFTITIVAFQLTSSQFSPRALRNFLRDSQSQVALGVFIGTFSYAFVALAAIRYSGSERIEFVPAITVTGCYVLVGACIVLFVRLIHHMADSMRAVTLIERIATETRSTIERQYPLDGPSQCQQPVAAAHTATINAERSGVITDVELDHLCKLAAERDVAVEVVPRVGAFVCKGDIILRVFGEGSDGHDELRATVRLGKERSMRDDAGFGFRQLVDIAERALSPGINDPTTAMQCIDRIHDLLRRLSGRPMPDLRIAARDDVPRAWLPLDRYEDFVDLATAEIIESARGNQRILRRLRDLLDDLVACADDSERLHVLIHRRLTLIETHA